MRLTALATMTAILFFSVAVAAQECTTTTTTTVTCKGSAAPLALPSAQAPDEADAPGMPGTGYDPRYAPPRGPQLAPPVYIPAPAYYAPIPPLRSHVEEQRRWGLFIAGISVFGVSYLLNASTAYLSGEGMFAVPIAGPLMYADRHNKGDDSGNRFVTSMMVFDTLVQTTGAVLAIVGLATTSKVTVFDRVTFVPTFGAGNTGLAAVGRF